MDFAKDVKNNIMLEPRLQEYITRKINYQRDNVEPSVPLEKTYRITEADKRVVKRYMRGKKNAYSRSKADYGSDFIKPEKYSFKSSDEEFKKDPRYKKLQKKMQSQRDAQGKRDDYKHMYDNYKMYHDEEITDQDLLDDNARYFKRPHKNHMAYDESSINPYSQLKPRKNGERRSRRRIQRDMKNSYMLNTRDDEFMYDNPNYVRHPNVKSNMMYHSEPKLMYNERLRWNQDGSKNKSVPYNHLIDDTMDEIDSYRDKIGRDSYGRNSEFGDYGRDYVSDRKSGHGHRDTNDKYRSVPYMHTNGMRDMDMDNYVRYGTNSRATKDVGYENPFEHYFQYINPEIQDPKHVLNPRGISSRLYNRERGRKYRRDIY